MNNFRRRSIEGQGLLRRGCTADSTCVSRLWAIVDVLVEYTTIQSLIGVALDLVNVPDS